MKAEDMCDHKMLLALRRRLRAWVDREEREWNKARSFPRDRAQRCLRRARIAAYCEEPDFLEALRELEKFA